MFYMRKSTTVFAQVLKKSSFASIPLLLLIHFGCFMLNLSFHCYKQQNMACVKKNTAAEKHLSLPSLPLLHPHHQQHLLKLIFL